MNPIYKQIQEDFAQWLATLGYAQSTVYGLPKQIKEFLEWLEAAQIHPQEIKQQHAEQFMEALQHRPNKRRKGGLSIAYLNKQIDGLNKLSKFLKVTHQNSSSFQLKQHKSPETPQRTVLSQSEIQALYQATKTDGIDDILGQRDRAMLGIYYGCGLRKSEGLGLEVGDILVESKLVYVRNPKNGQERYVPIPPKVVQDLQVYISEARPLFLNDLQQSESLFISQRGKPMHEASMVARLQSLKQKAGLQGKPFGLHALRHSIATHLLQSGMSLESIARFLGHKTLDSTQHYTHLAL